MSDSDSPADLGPEPEGFWTPIHAQVRQWLEQYGEDGGIGAD